jgi:ABC-type branched-subunit amino acid transport system permease subunit
VNQWLAAFTGAGVAAVLAAIVSGLFSKRKLSAEATKIITDAASGVVQNLSSELTRVTAQNATQAAQIARVEAEQAQAREHQRATDQALALHAFWDSQARDTLRANGIELPEPPPLPVNGGVPK